ncbi:hypothetical protein [Lacrimispora amygdalina]|uniref:hypothetical protein n=1 Tax=Lacrimispora amygdalina TaxID=253257 RepID=UPI000BE2994F|nr:hypothetical protein [Lacrimispora amygdalina]
MTKRIRKTSLEKLQEELVQVQTSMQQHKNNLEALKKQEMEIQEKIKLEQIKEISIMMDEHNVSIGELKALLTGTE